MNATSAEPTATATLTLAREPREADGREVFLRRQLLCADLVATLFIGGLAGWLAGLGWARLPLFAVVLSIAWCLIAAACGLYASSALRTWASGVGEMPRIGVTALVLSWPILGLAAALHAPRPVAAALGGCLLAAIGTATARAGARVAAHRTEDMRRRVVVVGSGVVAQQLIQRLTRHRELGFDAVGYLDDDAHDDVELGVPRLGTLDALETLLATRRVDRVMIAFTRAPHELLLHAIRVCRDAGVTVDIVPRLFEFLDGARTLDTIGGMPLLSISVPRFSRSAQIAKRALDLALAGLMLLTVAPLLAAIAVAIKLDSRGPVLFTQRRAGRGGRFFTLYKFRSMHVGAAVEVRDDGAIVKSADDRRVTRVGRIIRRFSLDEAPQLFNVLRGDMSLVGPRPLVMAEAAALSERWQARRADLRPGLTGPWQISGRSHIPFHDMIKFDYQYVAGWSLARDIEILLSTLPAVLSGRGAF